MKNYSTILRLSWPLMLSFFSYHVMGIVDVFMIGKLGGEAIAAVGLGITFLWFMIAPFEGFLDNALILFSKAAGRNDKRELKSLLYHELLFCVLISVILLGLFFIVQFLLEYASSTPNVFEMAREYLLINIFGSFAFIAGWVLNRFLISIKQNKITPVFSIISVLLNIFLNYLLIYGNYGFPQLGVKGAAIATAISRVAFLIMVSVYIFKIQSNYFEAGYKPKIQTEYLSRIFKLGLPMAQTTLIEVTSWTVFVSWIGRLGTASLASHEIALKIKDFLLIPGHSIGSVTTSLVSENLAKHSDEGAKENSLASIKILMALMGGVGVGLFIFSNQLVSLFIDNYEIISTGSKLLKIMALYQIVDAIFIISRASLIAAEDVKFVRKIFLLGGWGFMLPLVYTLITFLDWNVFGAWIGFTIFIAISATLFAFRFFRTKWSSKLSQSQSALNVSE